MYYVITENGIVSEKDIRILNNKLNAKLDESEFTALGKDYVVNLTKKDFEFVRDKRNLERIPFERLLGGRDTTKMLLYVIITILLVVLLKC